MISLTCNQQTDEGNGNASTSVNSSTIATRRQKRQRRAETDPDAVGCAFYLVASCSICILVCYDFQEHTGTLSSTGVQGNSSTCHKTSNTSSSVRQRRQGSAQRSESLVVSSGNNSGMACPEDPSTYFEKKLLNMIISNVPCLQHLRVMMKVLYQDSGMNLIFQLALLQI